MNELKYKFEAIAPTTLHIHAEITTASFYASTAEDLDARIANLVEVFLLEVYRCKLCQFTSSLKNKLCLHVLDVHQLDQTPLLPESTEPEESDSYGIGEEMTQENKENEENLDKMPFLYRILNTMSPASCDMSLGDQGGNTNIVGASEVNSLFEEQSEFPLDESMPSDSIPPSSSANSPKSKEEDEAQCEHLLSLGLYRISNLRPLSLSTEAKIPQSNLVKESARTRSRCRKLANMPPLPVDHLKNNTEKKKSYRCASCELEFNTKDTYKVHVQCHKHGGGFTCMYCGAFMSEWDPMEKHIKSHRLVRKSYQCQVCEKRFMTQSAWKSHMRGHDQKSEVFLCTKCPLSFEIESVRNLHVTCHNEDVFKCCHCGLVEQEWNKIYEHMSSHDSSLKPFTCSPCDKRFFTKSQVKAHSSKHKKHTLLTCPFCNEPFKNIRQMTKHQKIVHPKQNNTDCKKEKAEIPNRVLVPESSVNPQSVPKRKFSCDICNRNCSSKLALQRHMGVHAGVKPFHCSHCDYKTRLKASLTQHLRVHTGEKPFKCKLCSYASIDASSLRRHIRTHTSEKPYKCQLCSYSCNQKKSLDLHIRRHHTGEMFKCNLCQYSTPDKQLLHKHTKKHHANEDLQLSSKQLPTS
ncbi:gastrula zinc finger protein XlCGF57.1-like [Bufo gargarizans]|uniref:gastrula zinc finger protein XlCGF57.1-like n=1 Tax=Bufo gargarizans TaxID=30331 RepID=UPI001CF2CB41|nr:gastrula zinc finger protein XlCGF57.1-like [Bufo gargarizans]XP_044149784.1 gastrula zinc finger protein XlCGF57.1-like [Bufo gargarizans]